MQCIYLDKQTLNPLPNPPIPRPPVPLLENLNQLTEIIQQIKVGIVVRGL